MRDQGIGGKYPPFLTFNSKEIKMFKTGEKVFLRTQDLMESAEKELDAQGFIVLCSEPDLDDTIPTKRVSDGQYACLPTFVLADFSSTLTGSFVMDSQGKVTFKHVQILSN